MHRNDLTVEHQGSKIILPLVNGVPMQIDEAISWLTNKVREDAKETVIQTKIPCYPLDGIVAFNEVMTEKFGWVDALPRESFFGDQPPLRIGIPVGPGKLKQCFYGRVAVPGVSGFIQVDIDFALPGIAVVAKTQRRFENILEDICSLTRQRLLNNSIYKGKAIRVDFGHLRGERDDGFDVLRDAPQFMTLDTAIETSLIFGDRVANDLNIGLFAPIENTDACRSVGIPLKRGVLLYGPYGTGKTLTANITALKAQRNGWTFVYLSSVKDLKEGLRFAAAYAPAVVFVEDIDRAIQGERSVSMDEVLNVMDGIDTKSAELITVFTTNHVDRINPAMLRMGRLDSLIEVSPPDAGAAERLVMLYSRGLLEEGADLKSIGKMLAGKIPAFIREVTERAKIAAIARLQSGDIAGKVRAEDIRAAAMAMESHDALIWNKKGKEKKFPRMLLEIPAGHPIENEALDQFETYRTSSNGNGEANDEMDFATA